jgi:hypothetical protein
VGKIAQLRASEFILLVENYCTGQIMRMELLQVEGLMCLIEMQIANRISLRKSGGKRLCRKPSCRW